MIHKVISFLFCWITTCFSLDTVDNLSLSLNERIGSHLDLKKSLGRSLHTVCEEELKHVAIIDTGFYLQHEHLQERFLPGFNALTKKSEVGISFEYKGVDSETCFARNHGTQMASVVSQVIGDDEEGRRIKIVPIKVGLQPLSDLNLHINALNFIASRPDIAVVSISINYPLIFHAEPDTFPLFKEALVRVIDAGKLLVVSALNDKKFYIKDSPFVQFVLSAEAKRRIIVVGATEANDEGEEVMASFSNKAGAIAPQFIAATGSDIICATYLFKDKLENGISNGRELASGSSHATAVVAGSLISLVNHFPKFHVDEIREILFASALRTFKSGARRDIRLYGNGLLNLDQARILAATKLIHRRTHHVVSGSIKEELKTSKTLAKISPGSSIKKEYLSTPWGNFVDVQSGHKRVHTYWKGLKTEIKKKAVNKNSANKIMIQIPDLISPGKLFSKPYISAPVNVFYTPISQINPDKNEDTRPRKGYDVAGVSQDGKTEGIACAYTILLNSEGKMVFVHRDIE